MQLIVKWPLTSNATKLFNVSAVNSAGDGTADLKKRVEELTKSLVDYEAGLMRGIYMLHYLSCSNSKRICITTETGFER